MATIARQESEARKSNEVQAALDEGEALEKKGALEDALAAFRRAVEADPDSSKAGQARDRLESRLREISSVRALADEHLRDGRFEEALHSLEKLKGLLPGDEDLTAETDEAREKVDHIREALRRAEKAAAARDHKATAAAAKDVLDLSPNHIRAQSLKRDAEKALNAIDRHVKEAERLISSQIFEDALEQLKKAKGKGATEEMVAQHEKTAVDGITAALKTEATRFYSARDYSAALDAYERILELRGGDSDAKKGKSEAERRLRSLTSEPLAMRSVVAGAAAAVLLMFQIAAVQLRPPPTLRSKEEVAQAKPSIAGKAFEGVALLALEDSRQFREALDLWAKQEADKHGERMRHATEILPVLEESLGKAPEDPLDAIVKLQAIDPLLNKDPEFFEVRKKPALEALEKLTDQALGLFANLEKTDPDRHDDRVQAYQDAGLTTPEYLKATRLAGVVQARAQKKDSRKVVKMTIAAAKKAGTTEAWEKVESRIQEVKVNLGESEVAKATVKDLIAEFEKEWRESLKEEFRDGRSDDGRLYEAVLEASRFLQKFGYLPGQARSDPAALDAFVLELKGQ